MQDQMTESTRTERIIVRMSPELRADLEQTGNFSAYIRESVHRRLVRFRQAVAHLEGASFKRNEIRAVLDLINGTYLAFDLPLAQQVTAAMEDAAALDAIHEKWGIQPARWQRLIELAGHEPTARALALVADEYWSDANDHALAVL